MNVMLVFKSTFKWFFRSFFFLLNLWIVSPNLAYSCNYFHLLANSSHILWRLVLIWLKLFSHLAPAVNHSSFYDWHPKLLTVSSFHLHHTNASLNPLQTQMTDSFLVFLKFTRNHELVYFIENKSTIAIYTIYTAVFHVNMGFMIYLRIFSIINGLTGSNGNSSKEWWSL